MERKRTFFNQTYVCPNCKRVYDAPVNYCCDCGKCISAAGENLEDIKKKNNQIEILLKLVDVVEDKKTLQQIRAFIERLKA